MEKNLSSTHRSQPGRGAAVVAAGVLLSLSAAPVLVGAPEQSAPAVAPGRTIDSVETLLDALERADVGVRTFQSEIIYDRRFRLQGDRHIRWGRLFFQVELSPASGGRARRTFAVRFETLTIPDDTGEIRRADESLWVFDGQWLIEKREAERQFVKRQIARPEDPVDPLRLGEGPLPIPIGQRKADILARYDAEFLDAGDGLDAPPDAAPGSREAREAAELQAFVRETWQLRLIPKAGASGDEEFREVRLWYTRGALLPRAARTINRAGDESLVLLAGARVNEPLDPKVMSVAAPDPALGWSVQIDEGRVRDEAGEEKER